MRYDLPYGNFPGIWMSPCDDEKQPTPYMPIDPPACCEKQKPRCDKQQTRCDKQPTPCREDYSPTHCPTQDWRRDDTCCEQEEQVYDHRPCKPEKDCKQIPGMVYAAHHDPARLYDPMQALRRGTLYEELDKPMKLCNDQCTRVHCTREQMQAFTLWELRLYLNTHPNDMAALKLFQRLCRECGNINYACAFLPAQDRCWTWINDPWPWEYAANCEGRGKN